MGCLMDATFTGVLSVFGPSVDDHSYRVARACIEITTIVAPKMLLFSRRKRILL